MRWLRLTDPAFAVPAVAPPAAHLPEMPNELTPDGPLWPAVQQHRYRG